MARRIKISAVILNISLHPHSRDIYLEYLKLLYNLKKPIQIHGDRHAIISSIETTESDKGFVHGVITTFVKIDAEAGWFDMTNLREATDRQVSRISIPPNLAPNSASFYWTFDLKKHKLYIQSYSEGKYFNARQGEKFFMALASDLAVTAVFGLAKISIIQSRDALEKMFRIPRITRIRITILRPNPDVFADDFEANIEQHLAENHSRQLTLTYDAEKGGSITPGDDIRTVSHAALETGEVEVRGRNETGAVKRSTRDSPEVLQDKYDPEETSEQNAFKRLFL